MLKSQNPNIVSLDEIPRPRPNFLICILSTLPYGHIFSLFLLDEIHDICLNLKKDVKQKLYMTKYVINK
jgi:hypothetical protein